MVVKLKLNQHARQLCLFAIILLLASCGSPLQEGGATTGPGAIPPTVMVAPATTPQANQSASPGNALSPTMTPNQGQIPRSTASSTSTIQGTVVDPNGMPINGAMIDLDPLTLTGTPFEAIAVLSDDQGQYSWAVQPGRYRLTVIADGYQTVTQEVVAVGRMVQVTTTLATD